MVDCQRKEMQSFRRNSKKEFDLENNKYNSNKKCNCLNKKRIRKEEMCSL